MKVISGMLGVLMLTLLPLPLEAKSVYVNVMSRDLFSGTQNLESLDAIIEIEPNKIGDWFKQINANNDGNLRLGKDQALIIKGGRGSIGMELDQYKQRSIIGTALLKAYGCYKKHRLGKDNATYVIVSVASVGSEMRIPWCTDSLLISGGSINVGQLSAKAKLIPKPEN